MDVTSSANENEEHPTSSANENEEHPTSSANENSIKQKSELNHWSLVIDSKRYTKCNSHGSRTGQAVPIH